MAEFSAAASLEITVPQSELRSARSQIERELGDIEVGVSGRSAAPSGGRAVGAGGSEPADIDLSRRQLGQQESLVGLAEERNEFLQQLTEGDVGGGGGGPGGLGTLLQVQGARSVLGNIGTAAAGVGAAAGGTPAFFPGLFGRGGTGPPGELGPGRGQSGQFLTDLLAGSGIARRTPDKPGALDLNLPEGFPPKLQLPEAEFPPRLELPETEFPPRLQLPQQEFPPQLQLPQGDFPPQIQLPPELQDGIGVDIPPELQQLLQGGIDLNIGGSIDLPTVGEIQREIEQAVKNVIRNEFSGLL